MAETKKSVFNTLNSINVNEHVEVKSTGRTSLKYLSWSWAWAEVKKVYPDANYEVIKQANGLPYVFDSVTGYMVNTKVTIDGVTHEMWLPVMDSHNEAMLSQPRTVKTKYNSFTVESCTMFDVNKTIMRCLVKNLAMFGLGLYIYSGEDLPDDESYSSTTATQQPRQAVTPPPMSPQATQERNAALTAAINQAIDNLNSGIITDKAFEAKAKGYIDRQDLNGITGFNNYCNDLRTRQASA